MKKYNKILLFIVFQLACTKIINNKISLDSLFNIYKSDITNSHLYKEITNTTWKEYFISEKIKNLKKILPCHINTDNELDLFVQDHSDQLFWVNNIRGTSKDFTHKKLSNVFIGDFVVSNNIDKKDKNINNIYILTTNQNKDKIIKYKKNPYYAPLVTNDTLHNTKNYWEEALFMSINDATISSFIKITKYSKIKSIDIYNMNDDDYQILLLNIENMHTRICNLIKIRIKDEKIITIDRIGSDFNNITIIGLYDMNNDGLIDILYFDSNNILYVYLNQDPYYFAIEIYKINPTMLENSPRIFIFDANKDLYPDIITGDTKENTISLLLNPGKKYWKKIIDYYNNQKKADKSEIYKDISWQYLSLIDSEKEDLTKERLKDFTIIMIDKSKRISFEIVAIFGNNIYWFIEKDNTRYSSKKSTYHHLADSMKKCEIFIEKLNGNDKKSEYDVILDIDLNKDKYPEFILYSYKLENMIYIQRKETMISQYGWSQAFWIYLMIGIYTLATIVGGIEFYRLKNVNEKYSSKNGNSLVNNEEYRKSQNIELSKIDK
jgi:hypothetical protein